MAKPKFNKYKVVIELFWDASNLTTCIIKAKTEQKAKEQCIEKYKIQTHGMVQILHITKID